MRFTLMTIPFVLSGAIAAALPQQSEGASSCKARLERGCIVDTDCCQGLFCAVGNGRNGGQCVARLGSSDQSEGQGLRCMEQGEGPCYHNWDCCSSASKEMVCYGITEHHGGTCRVLRPLEGDSEGDGEGEEVGEGPDESGSKGGMSGGSTGSLPSFSPGAFGGKGSKQGGEEGETSEKGSNLGGFGGSGFGQGGSMEE